MPMGWMPLSFATSMATTSSAIRRVIRRALFMCHPLPRLEPDVLERLCGGPVEMRRKPVVAALRGKIPARDPRGCAMAGGAELFEARLGRGERRLRLVEAILLEQRAPEHELRVADLVDVVLEALEEEQRMPRLLLGLLDVAGAQVDLRAGRDRLAGVRVAAGLERDGDGLLQQRDRL